MDKTALHILYIIAHKNEGVPSGHLYALLMGSVDLAKYQAILEVACEKGLITIANHLIKPTNTLKQIYNIN